MTVNATLPVALHANNLESYIHSVNQMPMLTQEEEVSLADKLQKHNDVEAARQLVLSHLRVVVSIARSYSGYGLQQADLIQEGNIGLMKAVKRFDPNRGVRLFSFAVHWIKAEIHEFILKNWRLVRVATTKSQRKLFFNLRSMKTGFSALTPKEANDIAEQLGVKPEEVLEMEMRLNGQDISIEPLETDHEDAVAPIAYLADDENEPTKQLENRAVALLQGEGLMSALDKLDPRSRHIVESRWLSDDSGATLHELAAEYGVSAERIRQIEVKALQKMKQELVLLAS
ncbi:RNA polymerase sigma factor RpoH [Leeia sp. TBRC 13508]|uniref:RNA polymerase sigma factor RpoH n=1 Tax=Leeia speluncae TaxID=2884804 RepID=A0ABS8D4Y1_9NEIS|nr:RNA polymerase sigma factor RpoH [Leeia speluncae]MCB6183244.1 RNA polymerase sigma factor RpoH [Leeia speluncae]